VTLTPTLRKAHVIRIQNSPDGPDLADGTTSDQVASSDDIWLDVVRLDQIKLIQHGHPSGADGQAMVYTFKWNDGWPNGAGPANVVRKLHTLKITNPNDDTQWIKLDIIEQLSIVALGQGAGFAAGQKLINVHRNDDTNVVRVADVLTVYHTDVSQLDMSLPHDWLDYEPALMSGQQDTSQSLSVEIPKRFLMALHGATGMDPAEPPKPSEGLMNGQATKTVLHNDEVEAAILHQP
jgi:hypothetical protein